MGISYTLKISNRARLLRLQIQRSGQLLVTAPVGMSQNFIEQFIAKKAQWILEKIKYVDSVKDKVFVNGNRREYLKYKEAARILAKSRLEHFNQFYGYKFNRVSIKNQKSRWGSCSKKGNLNFNYKIVLLAPELADYIIVHELCHLGQMNHSKEFWKLVVRTLPNYKMLKNKFR